MYFLLGLRSSIETVVTLAARRPAATASAAETTGLRLAMLTRYHELHPEVPYGGDQELVITCEEDRLGSLQHAVGLSPDERTAPLNPTRSEAQLRDGLSLLAEVCPEASLLMMLTVDTVFCGGTTPGSMTSASAPGLVWVNPSPSWSPVDVAEALIHELTHTLLNLDELRYGHYVNYAAVQDHATWTRSAIRATPRPVNGALHSIFVAYELVRFRETVGQVTPGFHPASHVLRQQAANAIEALEPRQWSVMTPRMRSLVETLSSQWQPESITS